MKGSIACTLAVLCAISCIGPARSQPSLITSKNSTSVASERLLSRRRLDYKKISEADTVGMDDQTLEDLKKFLEKALDSTSKKQKKQIDAAKAGIKAIDDAISTLAKCTKQGAKCSGVDVAKSVFNIIGELGPIVSVLGLVSGPWFPVVGMLGQLILGFWSGGATGKKPLTKQDVKDAVGEKLYDVIVDEKKWLFELYIEDVFDKIELWSRVNSTSDWEDWKKVWTSQYSQELKSKTDELVKAYKFLVGTGNSLRHEYFGKDKFIFTDSCDSQCPGRIGDRFRGFCQRDADQCIDQWRDASKKWDELRPILEQFKLLMVLSTALKASTIQLARDYSKNVTDFEIALYEAPWQMLTSRQSSLTNNLKAIDKCAEDAGEVWPFNQRCTGRSAGSCNYAGAGAVTFSSNCCKWFELDRMYYKEECRRSLERIRRNNLHFPQSNDAPNFYADYGKTCSGSGLFPTYKICAAPAVCMAKPCRQYFALADPWVHDPESTTHHV